MGIIRDFRDFRKWRGASIYLNDGNTSPYVLNLDAEAIYRTQPNLQAVISYIADNAASIPLKVYRRASDTDRERITDSAAALTLAHPNPDMTAFELINHLCSEFALYGRGVWFVADADSPSGYEVYPIPNAWIIQYHGGNAWTPEYVEIMLRGSNQSVKVPASELVIFHNYDPLSPRSNVSPLDGLKQTLTEQIEADRFRVQMWKKGGRFNAYISRPKDVAEWSNDAAKRFKEALRSTWAGDDGANAGGIPVFEDGMELRQTSFNSREAQWAEAKKLSREEVAAAYHVNPSLIWHTDTQTYASAKDNKRAFYAETLDPIFTRFQQRITRVLLPRLGAGPDIYAEFDLSAKLSASYEELLPLLVQGAGGPILVRNEARAKLNLPAIEGGDEIILPLNVQAGAEASDETEGGEDLKRGAVELKAAERVAYKAKASEEDADRIAEVLRKFFARQARSIAPKLNNGGDWWDGERWDAELTEDLLPVMLSASAAAGRAAMRGLMLHASEYEEALTVNYVRKMAENRAKKVNARTRDDVAKAIADGAEVSEALAQDGDRATNIARGVAAAVAAFAAMEAVSQAREEVGGREVTKTWVATSANPRSTHAAMNGETVPYDGTFSNGGKWPGDTGALDAGETINCQCEVLISIG